MPRHSVNVLLQPRGRGEMTDPLTPLSQMEGLGDKGVEVLLLYYGWNSPTLLEYFHTSNFSKHLTLRLLPRTPFTINIRLDPIRRDSGH